MRSNARAADPIVGYLLRAAKPMGRSRGVLLGLAIVGAIATLDWWLGPVVQLSAMYMFGPIATAWCAGRRDALLMAAFAAATSTLMRLYSGDLTAAAWLSLLALLLSFVAMASVAVLVAETREMMERFEELSMHDELSALLNRRALLERLAVELARARRYSIPISLIYADVDDFKGVNDRFGHATGDEFLMRISEAIELSLRPADIAARVGGDEFVIVLPETAEAGALALAERLIDQLDVLRQEYGTGLSLGIAAFQTAPDSVEIALNLADSEMYAVKRARKAARARESNTTGAAPPQAPAQSTT